MTASALASLLASFPSRAIAVLGDFCVDYYLTIDAAGSEISVETGLPTRAVRAARISAGGAGNVVANLAAMGVGRIAAFGIVGDDPFGRELVGLLKSFGADTDGLLEQRDGWHTSVYTKLYEGEREHERVDYGNFNVPAQATMESLLRRLEERLPSFDAIVINQQVRSGIHSPPLREALRRLIARHPDRIFLVDSRSYSDEYPGTYRKLNSHEGARLCGIPSTLHERVGQEAAIGIAESLYRRWMRPVFLSRGEHGCLVRDEGGLHEIAGLVVSGSTDPVGAGDAMLAGVAAALAAGSDPKAAAEIGNFAAAVTVRKLYQTGTASPEEILAVGTEPDYRYRPELASSPGAARLLPGTEIEVITSPRRAGPPRYVLFDNDGTVSTLRQGWELVMEPMMVEAVLGDQAGACTYPARGRVVEAVRELIDRTTGVQTIVQMQELVELVRRFAVVDKEKILTAAGYKRTYNDRLMGLVEARLARLAAGELNASDFTMKGAVAFLEDLVRRGIKLYLASGTDQTDVEREAKALGYARFFEDRIFGSVGEVARDPKREVLRRIMAEIGDGAALLTFGDGPVEMRETRKAGGYAVGVASDEIRRWGLNLAKRSRLIQAGADLVVPDFSQGARLGAILVLDRQPKGVAMTHPLFDRHLLKVRPLAERVNKVVIARDRVDPERSEVALTPGAAQAVQEAAEAVRRARAEGRPAILAFGAHTIKNGLGPVLIKLMERGWITHLATNGAGIIHDWEFAYLGESSEDVRTNIQAGEFGIWKETGLFLNLAIAAGACEGLGYGESIGALVARDGIEIPPEKELLGRLTSQAGAKTATREELAGAAAAADLLGLVRDVGLPEGFLPVPHPFKEYGVQAAAYRLRIPFTGHPMFGHDIIYTHPASCGAAIGRAAERDFLSIAESISRIEGGVYLSVGSAVMSPMVFEKCFSMAQNIAIQRGGHIDRHTLFVVDLAEAPWDWQTSGEPPPDNPAYYLRYCKTFSRMGGTMRYVSADNRSFLVGLYRTLAGG